MEVLVIKRDTLHSHLPVIIAASYDLFVPKILIIHQLLIPKHIRSVSVEYFDLLNKMPQSYSQHHDLLVLRFMNPPYFNLAVELVLSVKNRGFLQFVYPVLPFLLSRLFSIGEVGFDVDDGWMVGEHGQIFLDDLEISLDLGLLDLFLLVVRLSL